MIGYRTIAAVALFSAGMLVGAPAQAQMITANPATVAAYLRSINLTVESKTDPEGDPLLETSMGENKKFSVYFYGCTNHANCASIQFYAGYTDAKVDADKLNTWNRKHRFGRAYIDGEGDPVVEMDIDLDDGGMSRKLFEDNFQFWQTLMNEFPKFVYGE